MAAIYLRPMAITPSTGSTGFTSSPRTVAIRATGWRRTRSTARTDTRIVGLRITLYLEIEKGCLGHGNGTGQSLAGERTGHRQGGIAAGVGRAGRGAAGFAWEEFFYAEHHNPHTQRAYEQAVRRFLAWCEGQGVELASITPGMVGQYLIGLGGSPAKRNQHLPALRGFFDRLVNRHFCILNPSSSVRGVKDQVIEGKTPEITIEQARTLLASVDTSHVIGSSACVTGRS